MECSTTLLMYIVPNTMKQLVSVPKATSKSLDFSIPFAPLHQITSSFPSFIPIICASISSLLWFWDPKASACLFTPFLTPSLSLSPVPYAMIQRSPRNGTITKPSFSLFDALHSASWTRITNAESLITRPARHLFTKVSLSLFPYFIHCFFHSLILSFLSLNPST